MSSRDWLYLLALFVCGYFAGAAHRHAKIAAKSLEDTKAAIAVWWSQAGPMADVMAERNTADMADALAERRDGERHWGAGGR